MLGLERVDSPEQGLAEAYLGGGGPATARCPAPPLQGVLGVRSRQHEDIADTVEQGPARSIAATVLAKVGFYGLSAIASTSALWSGERPLEGGPECSGWIAANGGSPWARPFGEQRVRLEAIQADSSGLHGLPSP